MNELFAYTVTDFFCNFLLPISAFCAGLLLVLMVVFVIRYISSFVFELKMRSSDNKRFNSCAYRNCFDCHSCPHYKECKINAHVQDK